MPFEEKLAAIRNFLPDAEFAALRETAERHCDGQRVHIAGHKRGATISYQQLRRDAPRIVTFYESAKFHGAIATIVGENVMPTPMRDQSSCSLLIYDRPGDRIGWHYDHNFYNGRHFTALLSLVNERAGAPGLSSSRLVVRKDNREAEISTPPNTLVVFEGGYIYHGVTALNPGERRIILSMTFCTDPTTTRLKDFTRRVKDIAYFGLRAFRPGV